MILPTIEKHQLDEKMEEELGRDERERERASESEVPDNNNNYTSWPLRQLLSCVCVCDSYLLGRASSRKNKGNTTGGQNNEKQWNTEQKERKERKFYSRIFV